MDIIKTLSKVSVFAELEAAPLSVIASYGHILHLQTGQMLYQLNDIADHVYIIAYGRVKLTTASGLSTYLGRHEIVGEMGNISKQPHHGTVHAIRDTTFFAIPQQPFLDFIHQYPKVLLALTRLIIARTQPELQHTHAMSHNRTLSVVPVASQIPAIHLAEQLTEHYFIHPWAQADIQSRFRSGARWWRCPWICTYWFNSRIGTITHSH